MLRISEEALENNASCLVKIITFRNLKPDPVRGKSVA